MLNYTRKFIFLEEGDIAEIEKENRKIYTENGKETTHTIHQIDWNPVMAERGGYRHFMEKEIHEQPRSITDTIRGRIGLDRGEVYFEELENKYSWDKFKHIIISACGTSWHAALIGKLYMEKFAKIPVSADIASELRYRDIPSSSDTLFISISQSGETADTIAGLRIAKSMKIPTLSICNVLGSTIARESDSVIYTHAGPEIGVASTKAFTSQIAILFLLSVYIGRKRGMISHHISGEYLSEFVKVPDYVKQVLDKNEEIENIAKNFKMYKNFLYLGRGFNYPSALEGALKLKEISYIHAEGYPAAEMKHGPIALIDENMPVIFIAVKDKLYQKIISNMEEIKSRGGSIITITDKKDKTLEKLSWHIIEIPEIDDDFMKPLLTVIPLQLLAYFTATRKGCNVDKPRNLAKAVTVE